MTKTIINVSIQQSTRRRLDEYSKDHNLRLGEIVDVALQDYFEKQDRHYVAPDPVLDRINQLFMSQMQIAQTVGQIKDRMDEHE